MSNYQQLARQTYGPHAKLRGDGPWALEKPGTAELFHDRTTAEQAQLARGGRIMRLIPKRLELKEWPD